MTIKPTCPKCNEGTKGINGIQTIENVTASRRVYVSTDGPTGESYLHMSAPDISWEGSGEEFECRACGHTWPIPDTWVQTATYD